VNSPGNRASGLMVLQGIFLRIPDNLSIEQEEDVFYGYISGKSAPKCKKDPNAIQHEFILNSCDEIISDNSEMSIFKDIDFSTSDKRFIKITALFIMASQLPTEKVIINNLTIENLQEDFFFMYFKKYSVYRRSPDNLIFNNKFNPVKNRNTNNYPNNMEQLFADALLNEKANKISALIKEVSAPITTGGNMMEAFGSKGLQIAKDLLENCIPDLAYIKNKVGSSNEVYMELSITTAIMASAIIKMPVSLIGIEARNNGFHADKSKVQQKQIEISEATRLMGIISNFDLSQRARQTLTQNQNILTESRNALNKKSFWGNLFS